MSEEMERPDYLGSSFATFMDQFLGESDRAAVILGAAKIEYLLGQLLDKYLLPCPSSSDDLLDGDAPLSTFSAKIKLCHRLGLVDDHFAKLLNIFRKLRNGFAHEVTVGSLSSGSARDRVVALAEPFADTRYFQSLNATVASKMERDLHDPGVIFRVVLAVFHLHLLRSYEGLIPLERTSDFEIVATCKNAVAPGGKDHNNPGT
jgi:hypothetical protein